MKCVAGYVFHQDGNRRLTYRKSWYSYAVVCVMAAVFFLVALVYFLTLLSDRTIYVGGTRHSRGRPVAPADQTWVQFFQSTVCVSLGGLAVLIVPIGYIVGGSEEQRNPFIFDRERDRVMYGRKEVGKLSRIVAIRLVETRVGRYGKRTLLPGRTGIFAKLKGAPWSIELGCFSRFATAQKFAQEISGFLNVGLYDDPLFPRQEGGAGFEVIIPPSDGPKPAADES